jgi:hypothetical protein
MTKLKKLLPNGIVKESVVSEAPGSLDRIARRGFNLKSFLPASFRKSIEPYEAVEYINRLLMDIAFVGDGLSNNLKEKVRNGELDDATRREIIKLADEIDYASSDVFKAHRKLKEYLDSLDML